MKKNVRYVLFAVVCSLGFFTACDDDDESDTDWTSISNTYSDNSLELLMDELTIPVDGKSVTIAASSASAATVTLTNVIPENASVTIDVTMSSSDEGYTFSGSNSVNDCTVSVDGTVDDGVASIVYTRTLTSDVVGEWSLASGTDAIYTNITLGNTQIDALSVLIGPMLSSLIWGKVYEVNVSLPESGLFGVSWLTVGESDATDLSSILNIFGIQYCMIDDTYYIAVDKNYVTLLTTLLESFASEELESLGISIDTILEFFEDLGGYYGFALNVDVDGDSATFYLGKEAIVSLVTLISPYLTDLIPEDYQSYVTTLIELLPNAEALEFGLNLTK